MLEPARALKNDQLSHDTLRKLFADSLRCQARWMNRAFEEIVLDNLPQGRGWRELDSTKRPRADIFEINLSWNAPKPTIYEVKASRADFRSDVRAGKYQSYLPYCERLYFVFPKGLIATNEIPAEAGAIRWDNEAEKGKRRMVKRAPNRKVDLPLSVLWQCLIRASKPGTYQPMKEERRLNALREAAKFALDPTHRVHYTNQLIALQSKYDDALSLATKLDEYLRKMCELAGKELPLMPDTNTWVPRHWSYYETAKDGLAALSELVGDRKLVGTPQ